MRHDGDTLPSLLDDFAAAADETARAIASVSLDDQVPVPQGVPSAAYLEKVVPCP